MGKLFSLAMIVALAFAGCGKATAPPPSKANLSAETKTLVSQFVDKANKRQAGRAELTVLVENLEARSKELGAGHKPVLDAAKALQAAYGKSPTEVKQRLEELSQAAAKL